MDELIVNDLERVQKKFINYRLFEQTRQKIEKTKRMVSCEQSNSREMIQQNRKNNENSVRES